MVFGFTDFNLGDSRQVMPLRMHWAKHIVQEGTICVTLQEPF